MLGHPLRLEKVERSRDLPWLRLSSLSPKAQLLFTSNEVLAAPIPVCKCFVVIFECCVCAACAVVCPRLKPAERYSGVSAVPAAFVRQAGSGMLLRNVTAACMVDGMLCVGLFEVVCVCLNQNSCCCSVWS